MRQLIRIILLFVAATSSLPSWATLYQHFTHTDGGFAFEYPSGWKLSPGLQTVAFTHPDDKEVTVRVGAFPLNGNDPRTSEEYVATTIKSLQLYSGHLDRKDLIQVSGRDATRLEFVEEHSSWRQASGVEIIVPNGAQYYVLSLFGKVADVALIRLEFDRIVSSLRLGQAPKFLMEWGGTYDGPKEAKRMVAKTPGELHGMIRVFGQSVKKLIPEGGLDFNAYMLAGISMGQKPTGGYSVRIEDTNERGGILYVRYFEQSPKPTSMVTQAFTSTYHLKLLPASKVVTVRFEKICEPEIADPDKSSE
jgi:PrcB C-terminal